MNKPKALFTFSYGEDNFNKIRELGFDVTYIPEKDITAQDMNDYEVMVCFNPFDKIKKSHYIGSLKWIQLVSKGINHVPDELKENDNIIITNNANTTCVPIAELIISLLLQIFKQSKFFEKGQKDHLWNNNKDILEVFGKVIGILGTGNIATQTAKRLKAFSATVLGVNSNGHSSDCVFDEVYSFENLDSFWERCDVIISTLPATDQTYHLLCEETFSRMKKGVSIINVSRGSVICEKDLISRLQENFFRGVALDVFEKEPLDAKSALWDFDNVIITPHNALYSDLYDERLFDMIYKNMANYINGLELLNKANFKKGY